MDNTQRIFVGTYAIFALLGFLYGFYKISKRKDNLGSAHIFNLIGAFVWADAVVLGIFWTITSLITLFLDSWILFLLLQSIFWAVRSFGEVTYWFNQQFSKPVVPQNEKTWAHKIFGDNYTSWFVHQIIWQCILVVTIILSVYLTRLWLLTL